MLNFTKKRFLEFPLRQQHKKCAELIRYIYDRMLVKESFENALDHYNEIQKWMNVLPIQIIDSKIVSNIYHHHLELAKVNIRENNLLPYIRTGDKPSGAPLLPISIYLDNIRSAFNVGSILRTTEAFALGSIHFSEKTPYIDNRQVQNTSMDAYQWLPCHKNACLDHLPRPIIVMETSPNAISIHDFIFPEKFTLVLGNEEYGVSNESIQKADYLLEIPMCGKKNSLNVANAFAITAAEIQRQKFLRDVNEESIEK